MQRNIVIAGGTKGIGLELLRQLRGAGDNVLTFARTRGELVDSELGCFREFDFTSQEFGSVELPEDIHGAVYCPGSINLRSFRALKADDFRHDWEVNVLGAVSFLQGCLAGLKQGATNGGGASVVLFSTVAVQLGMPMHASIAAAKGAIEGLSRSLAAEWAPQIRVNCLAPALTDTSLAAKLLSTPEKREAMGAMYPLKRLGSPTDLASMARVLLATESSWMTGQVIGVDGGLSAVKTG